MNVIDTKTIGISLASSNDLANVLKGAGKFVEKIGQGNVLYVIPYKDDDDWLVDVVYFRDEQGEA